MERKTHSLSCEYERRFQVQRDQIRGKTDHQIHPDEIAEGVRANDRQAIETGTALQFEVAIPAAGSRTLQSKRL
jgi:hypothetical protein